MKTRSTHRTNFGRFAPSATDPDGYITYHISPRYARLDEAALRDLADGSRYTAVRAAARIELAERAIRRWRETGEV